MKIDVTAEDIAAGQQCSALYCPVAKAIKRATGQRWWVSSGAIVPWEKGCLRPMVSLPEETVDFIEKFDSKLAVQPFSFELPLP